MTNKLIDIKHITTDSFRFDPSFHLSEAIQLRKELDNVPYSKILLKDVVNEVFLGNIFSRNFVKDFDHGVPYLAASDTVLFNHDTERYISKKQAKELNHLILKKDWIVITCSGTIGNVTYTDASFEGHLATHDLIRVIPNHSCMLGGYLYAYLSSKYGFNQLTQSRFGGVVKHINAEHVTNIVVPQFPEAIQSEVDILINKANRLKERAKDLLKFAKNEIQSFCSTPFQRSYGCQIKSIGLKSIQRSFNLRLNPTYFINNGVTWIKECHKEVTRLGDCRVKLWYPGIFKRTYVKNGLPYIKGSALFLRNPFKSCEMLSKSMTPNLEELWLKEGMILISCAGLCGEVKIITKEYEEKKAIGSPDIIRIYSSDELFTNEYIYAYLQLPAIYEYMQSLKYGSVIERFDSYNIENLPIIIPTKELSIKVTKLIQECMSCTYEAFVAEEKAITIVEQEIEKWNK